MLTISNPDEVDWANIPKEKLLIGNALDSFITYNLVDQIKIPANSNQVAILLSKCLPVFSELEYNGLDIDCEKLKTILDKLKQEIIEIEDSLKTSLLVEKYKDETETDIFNIKSSKQLNAFFKYSESILATTFLTFASIDKSLKTGLYSFNEANLKKLEAWLNEAVNIAHDSSHGGAIPLLSQEGESLIEVVNSILKLRELYKLRDSYFQTSLDVIENIGVPKLFCQYNLTGTVTGRLSCEAMSFNKNKVGVSMHTLPRNEQFNMRDVVVPSKKEREAGDLFVTIDYSSMELRVMAQACQDIELCAAYQNEDSDLHTITASKIFGKDASDITAEERQTGKMTNFLTIYGGGPKRLAESLGKPLLECKRIIRDYHKAFPGIDEYRNRVVSYLRRNNHSVSLFGRYRHLIVPYKDIYDKFDKFRVERQAVNSIIQSTASDILLVALLNFDMFIKEKNLKGRIVATVHDSIEFVMSSIDFFKYFQEILNLFHHPNYEKVGMANLYEYGPGGMLITRSIEEGWTIPLEIDVEVGRSFGSNIPVKFKRNKDTSNYDILNPGAIVNYVKELSVA